jgi:microcystin-dependent protein
MDYNFDLQSSRGQQEFKAWVDRTIKNEVNSYTRQVLAVDNSGISGVDGISSSATSSVSNRIIPPGTIVPFAGITVPTGWLLCNNQAVNRNTYSNLFKALTITFPNVSIINGAPTISGLSNVNTSGDWVGSGSQSWGIAGDGIPSGTYITSSTSTSINVSNSITKTTVTNIIVGPFGFTGDNNTTTFNVPDLRGRVPAGRDAMDATATNRITTVYAAMNGNVLGVGAGTQSMAHFHYASDQGGNLQAAIGAVANNVASIGYVAGGITYPGSSTATYAISGTFLGTNANSFNHYTPVYGTTSGATSVNNVQPTLITNYIIKT